MKRGLILLLLLAMIVSVARLMASWPSSGLDGGIPTNSRGIFSLARPAFAQEGSFLDQVAGIAAWVNVGKPLDIAAIKAGLSDVQESNDNYVVGVVRLNGVSTLAHPNVMITADGWVVAYFLRGALAELSYRPIYSSRVDGLSRTTLSEAIKLIAPDSGGLEERSIPVVVASPDAPTPTLGPLPTATSTPTPTGRGGGCTAPVGADSTVDAGWVILGMTLVGLLAWRRRPWR